MEFLEKAREKLKKELDGVNGQKEGAVKLYVMEALLRFAEQDEEFAQAIVQGGSFKDCVAAVCKGVGNSISDLEAYRRAAAFYFPGSTVRFEMHIDLIGEAGALSVTGAGAGDSSPMGGAKKDGGSAAADRAKGGLVIDLADFL